MLTFLLIIFPFFAHRWFECAQEFIAIVARTFAIVNVWDARGSDRPYRKAWARKYRIEQAGKYFDPQVAPVFLELQGNEYCSF